MHYSNLFLKLLGQSIWGVWVLEIAILVTDLDRNPTVFLGGKKLYKDKNGDFEKSVIGVGNWIYTMLYVINYLCLLLG